MSLRVPPCHLLHIARTAPTRYFSCVRAFSSTRRVAAEAENEDAETVVDDRVAIPPEGEEPKAPTTRDLGYEAWIDTEGERWRHPDPLGPKWLGMGVPFPLNPTFKPPTPVSDALRSKIYTAFVTNPKVNDLRTLSTRYGLAIKRVEAIIRLKALEEQWKKESKPLQTGFLQGMERLLGLNVGGQPTPVNEEINSKSRKEVAESDEVSRQISETGNERKRSISRTFFEPVDEGEPSLVPRLLEEERVKGHRSVTDPSTYPSTVVQPDPSKPPIRFVDVGLRWINYPDVERRAKESTRRKAVKSARMRSGRREAID